MTKHKEVEEENEVEEEEVDEVEEEIEQEHLESIGAYLRNSHRDTELIQKAYRIVYPHRHQKWGRMSVLVLNNALEYCRKQRAEDQRKEFWKNA